MIFKTQTTEEPQKPQEPEQPITIKKCKIVKKKVC